MLSTPRSYSRLTEEALVLLGKQIRLARKRRRMSEHDLAARIGVARSTGNGGAKLVHGSGGIVSLRAEQNSAT